MPRARDSLISLILFENIGASAGVLKLYLDNDYA